MPLAVLTWRRAVFVIVESFDLTGVTGRGCAGSTTLLSDEDIAGV
jgi:hypothetical protein